MDQLLVLEHAQRAAVAVDSFHTEAHAGENGVGFQVHRIDVDPGIFDSTEHRQQCEAGCGGGGRFGLREEGFQASAIARLECFQMPITIGEGDTVDCGAEVRGPTIGERRAKPAHSGLDVGITVHRPRVIR